jgi:hypothetical protein
MPNDTLRSFQEYRHLSHDSKSSVSASKIIVVRFEVFPAVTMTNAVYFDIVLYGSCKKRHFGGTYRLHHQGDKNRRARSNVSNN